MGMIMNRRRTYGGGGNPFIQFADPAVKTICVANWGGADGGTAPLNTRVNNVKVTGVNGELTYKQAESIIRITNNQFQSSEIVSFRELKYFISLRKIESNSFKNCSDLTAIEFPDSITSIGYEAFVNCTKLKDVHISNLNSWLSIAWGDNYGSTYYARTVYVGGVELTGEVLIPNSITQIKTGALQNLDKITSVVTHDNVTSIGNYAFYKCSTLSSITIGKKVSTIGFSVVENSSFSKIYYNSTIEDWMKIDFSYSVFGGGYSLHSKYALYVDNQPVHTLVIPQGTKEIKTQSFYNNTGLTSVYLPDGLEIINRVAFSECRNIVDMNIPSSVTTIGISAFSNCVNWTGSITIPSAVISLNASFGGCTKIANVTLNEGLVEILGYCFNTMTALRGYFIIPSTVTKIQGGILYNTNYVEGLIIKATTPPSGGNASYGFSKPIYVPDESVEEYKNSTDWSPYANKIHPISELPTNIINNL